MAIAKMERVHLIAAKQRRDDVLRLLQSFQKLEIEQILLEEQPADSSEGASAEWRESLQRIEGARNALSQVQKQSALARLRAGRKTLSMAQLEREVQSGRWREICAQAEELQQARARAESRRTELLRQRESWSPWRGLTVYPGAFSGLRYAAGCLCVLPENAVPEFSEQYREALGGLGWWAQAARFDEKAGLVLLYPAAMEEALRPVLEKNGALKLTYPFEELPQTMLSLWEEEAAALVKEETEREERLNRLAAERLELELAEEYYGSLLLREEAARMLPESKTCFLLKGWVLTEDKDALARLLKDSLKGACYLSFTEVSREDCEGAPVALKNPKVIRAFEILTEMYSMPAYDEVDPTPVMAPFYLVFFGMMVADAGYGLILLAATFLARRFFRPDRELRRNIDFFFYLSFPVIAWGLIFGSFFGVDLPFRLFSPTRDIIPILLQSIAFGYLHIMTALGISAYIHLRNRDVPGALENGFAWMGLLLGLALLALSKLILDSPPLFYAAAGISLVSVVLIVVLPALQSRKHRIKGFLKGVYNLYGATGYIGDLVSYSRLMALGVAGGSIAVAFNTIIATLPLPARLTVGVLLAVALQSLNLFLSLLGAYVHGIRLQYVEMFGKFYTGGGRKFRPFKPAEKYIYLSDCQSIEQTEE